MAKFIKKSIDTTIENNILTASIISTKYLEEILTIYSSAYIKNSFARTLMKWIWDYYENFGLAPGKTIQSIYDVECATLDDEDAGIIKTFLAKLSKSFVEGQGVNDEYILEQTLGYFRKREVEIRVDNAQKLLQVGKLDKAEEELFHMRKVMRVVSQWNNPLTMDSVHAVFEDNDSGILRLPGAFGDFVGDLERGWLIAYLAPFKRGKCAAKGTPITMADGSSVPIEKVPEGSIALSMDEHHKIVPNEVLKNTYQGIKDVYEVRTKTGRMVCTTINHPFFTGSGWKKLEDLNPGNFIAVPRVIPNESLNREKPFKLKLLAYLLADGCMMGASYTYSKNDPEMHEEFKKCVYAMGDSTSDMIDNCTTSRITHKHQKRGSNTRQWIASLGLHKSLSKNKFIPSYVLSLCNDDLVVFLNALFSGDGSVWKDRNNLLVDYSTSSKTMAYQIQELLLRFGIISKLHERNITNYISYEITITGTTNTKKFLDEIGFSFKKAVRATEILKSLDTKRCEKSGIDAVPYEVIKEIIPFELRWRHNSVGQCYKKKGKISNTMMHNLIAAYPDNGNLHDLVNGDILFDEIVSITHVGKHDTYDLTMKESSNFIAGNIIIHNTWFLQEAVVQGALAGLKTVFISCEMKEKNVNERLFKRLTAYGKETSNKVPVFDCVLNQTDECTKPCRTNYLPLYSEEESPEFDPDSPYKVCSICKDTGDSDYTMTTWFEIMEKKEFNHYNVGKSVKSIVKYCGDNIRIKCYPRFTASVKDVERDLDILEQVEGFIPDLIAVDYAGILRPESSTGEVRHGIDEIWKSLAAMAARRSAITFSASQGTRNSLYKDNMDQTDLAEWIGILGHVDKMVAINQSAEEKKMGVIRLGMLADRHKEFHEDDFVYILQALALGQAHLDSYSKKHY